MTPTPTIQGHASTHSLPPVRITLPIHLFSAFALLTRAHGARIDASGSVESTLRDNGSDNGSGISGIAEAMGHLNHITVRTEPQLPLWVLAAWAEVYCYRLTTAPERGIRLIRTHRPPRHAPHPNHRAEPAMAQGQLA